MMTVSNILTLLRAPLALVFLLENQTYRLIALCLALASDGLDGFLARRWKQSTQLGAVMDPLVDKFFALFVFSEQALVDSLEVKQEAGVAVRGLIERNFAYRYN